MPCGAVHFDSYQSMPSGVPHHMLSRTSGIVHGGFRKIFTPTTSAVCVPFKRSRLGSEETRSVCDLGDEKRESPVFPVL